MEMQSIFNTTESLSRYFSTEKTYVIPTNTSYKNLLSINYTSLSVHTCNAETGTFENVAYLIFMVFLLLAGVVGNSLVISAVIMSRSLRRKVTFHFIISLAFSDLILGLFQIPFKISSKLYDNKFCHALPACYIMIITDAVGYVACILSLFLIAIDRFVAIKMAFRYGQLLTTSRTRKLIASVWIFSLIWSFLGIFSWKPARSGSVFSILRSRVCANDNYYFYAASYFGVYIPVLVVITCTYIMILHVALTQIRAIERMTVRQPHKASLISNGSLQIGATENPSKRRRRKLHKELKATKSVAIVYLAFVICWAPSCVINIIIMIKNIFPDLQRNNHELFLFIYYFFIQILPLTTTMINPIIYCFSNAQFRRAFKTVCFKVLGKHISWHERSDSFRTASNMTRVSFDPRSSYNNNHNGNQSADATIAMLGSKT